ncbi:MAG: hypothetical protein QOH43_909 [Solirubrobacteraceae bacterium]|nr:hypothetical protein [Solirubrobacteraceae bacterium]
MARVAEGVTSASLHVHFEPLRGRPAMHPHLHTAYAQAVAPRPRLHAHHRADARPVRSSLRRLTSRQRTAPAGATSSARAGAARAIPS